MGVDMKENGKWINSNKINFGFYIAKKLIKKKINIFIYILNKKLIFEIFFFYSIIYLAKDMEKSFKMMGVDMKGNLKMV
jgi:expansin (peptidoglycan-binding protein)